MIVTTAQLYNVAYGKSVGAYNINNMEQLLAVPWPSKARRRLSFSFERRARKYADKRMLEDDSNGQGNVSSVIFGPS
jgi:hypothetical protein